MTDFTERHPRKIEYSAHGMFTKDSFCLYNNSKYSSRTSNSSSHNCKEKNKEENIISDLEAMLTKSIFFGTISHSSSHQRQEEKRDSSIRSDSPHGSKDSESYDNDEYGYYEDVELDGNTTESSDLSSFKSGSRSSSISSSISCYSPSVSSSTFNTLLPSSDVLNQYIICTMEDSKAPLVCRSFYFEDSMNNVSVCLALTGLRVVQQGCSEEAEYKISFLFDDKETITWKKYNDFRLLGRACIEYSRDSGQMESTVDAWKAVERHRPWWAKPPNTMKFMREECELLETFMHSLLFEVPCIQMLVEFSLP